MLTPTHLLASKKLSSKRKSVGGQVSTCSLFLSMTFSATVVNLALVAMAPARPDRTDVCVYIGRQSTPKAQGTK